MCPEAPRKPVGRPAAAATQRIPGTLLPFYELLTRQLPHRLEAQTKKELCFAIAENLPEGMAHPTPQSLSDNLGGLPDADLDDRLAKTGQTKSKRARGVHPKYFAAFKIVFGLEELGFSDKEILAADPYVFDMHFCDRPSRWLWNAVSSPAQSGLDATGIDTGTSIVRAGFWPEEMGLNATFGPGSQRFAIFPEHDVQAFPVGERYRLKIRLPFAGHVLVLSQDPNLIKRVSRTGSGAAIEDTATVCLNDAYGIDDGRIYGPGDVIFPEALAMDPPEGLTRTIILVQKTRFLTPWAPGQSAQISHEQLITFHKMLRNVHPGALVAGRMEYWVGRKPNPAPSSQDETTAATD